MGSLIGHAYRSGGSKQSSPVTRRASQEGRVRTRTTRLRPALLRGINHWSHKSRRVGGRVREESSDIDRWRIRLYEVAAPLLWRVIRTTSAAGNETTRAGPQNRKAAARKHSNGYVLGCLLAGVVSTTLVVGQGVFRTPDGLLYPR